MAGEIYKMELDGTVIGKFGKPGKQLGEFSTVHAIDCRNPDELDRRRDHGVACPEDPPQAADSLVNPVASRDCEGAMTRALKLAIVAAVLVVMPAARSSSSQRSPMTPSTR